jgi:hypothetical protein
VSREVDDAGGRIGGDLVVAQLHMSALTKNVHQV